MMRIVLFLLMICPAAFYAQTTNLEIELLPIFKGETLTLETEYNFGTATNKVKIETLRFYLSKLILLQDDSIVYAEAASYRLIDLENPSSLRILLKHPKITFNKIGFCIGIDSLTNVSGAMGGDLDPTNGMYWAWQSGYINFKIEGKSKNSPSRYKQFQYHLGGYLYPNNALQTLRFKTNKKQKITFILEVDKFLNGLDISKVFQIMSPSENSVLLSKKLAQLFKVK